MAPTEDKDADNNAWTWAALEPQPTDNERELLDRFCDEYAMDGNATLAASRCGFQGGFAKEYGQRFLTRAYVQQRLKFLAKSVSDLPAKEQKKEDTHLALSTLRKVAASEYQPGNVRVQAAARLLDHHYSSKGGAVGKPTEGAGELGRGGVMAVPAIASLDDWEAAASASQQKLAEVSRV